MRAKVIGNLAIITLATICFFSQSAYATVGTLYDTSGDVKTALGSQPAQKVGKGAPLENNMIVSTGEASSAVLKFEDGQIIALQSNSSFQIHDYSYDSKNAEKSNIFFSMLKGGLRAITGLVGAKHPAGFKLQTPNATIGIRGTDFMLVMSNPLYANIVSGSISITNTAGTAVFGAGQAAIVTTSATTLPAAISAAAIPAGTFTQLGAIAVPVSPPPGAGAAPGGGAGAGAGGTAAATAGVSTTAVAVGAAVAVGVAAASNNNSTTTHH